MKAFNISNSSSLFVLTALISSSTFASSARGVGSGLVGPSDAILGHWKVKSSGYKDTHARDRNHVYFFKAIDHTGTYQAWIVRKLCTKAFHTNKGLLFDCQEKCWALQVEYKLMSVNTAWGGKHANHPTNFGSFSWRLHIKVWLVSTIKSRHYLSLRLLGNSTEVLEWHLLEWEQREWLSSRRTTRSSLWLDWPLQHRLCS